MSDRFIVDDAGTLIDLETRDMFDIVEDVCPVLNKLNFLVEMLKQRNDNQAKQLDNLYTLIEREDWESLKNIIVELKEAEEQLQREWGLMNDCD